MPKILVVDDDPDTLTIIKIKLEMYGFLVEVVSHWPKIEKEINQFLPDLILLDVGLDGADGREICKKLKEDPVTNDIPVVLLSANHTVKDEHQKYKADNFIPKPLEAKNLVEVIINTLKNNGK